MLLCRMPRHRRRGTILVLFALLVFALLTMAALVIDLGLVRVTQQEMQSAVESAALEGLRYRDDISTLDAMANTDPQARDQARRQAASDLVAVRFDDDLNPANGDPLQVGAGPVLVPVGGIGQANALQALLVPQPPFDHVYKPNGLSQASPNLAFAALQTNQTSNLAQGDMVAGTFNSGMSPRENPDYTRSDFTPSDPGLATSASSLLVRMRRTDNRADVINNASGVSSHGPSLPLLFGRGALIASPNPAQSYSPRVHGLTVRATAIASSVPAKTVGPSIPKTLYPDAPALFVGLPGASPFGISLAAWTLGVTTLAASAQATDTTLTVQNGTPFPAVPFTVLVDAEILLVTAVDGTRTMWTVQRGTQASTAAVHQSGVQVQLHPYVYVVDPQGKISPTVNPALNTTLAKSVQLADLTITVQSGSNFPAVPFVVLVDTEMLVVTAVDTTKTVWTVQRGALSTTAAIHQSGAQVLLCLGTTLAKPAQATDLTLTVVNGSTFPAPPLAPPFMALVDSELVLVTAVDTTGNIWTVQRGIQGTTAATHSATAAKILLYAGQMLRVTSLTSPIGASDTSITVFSGANFLITILGFPIAVSGDPTKPSFLIRIENELLLVTDGGRTNTQWTVVRAQGGTKASAHPPPPVDPSAPLPPVLLHQAMGIGPFVDALPPPSPADGSTILTSSPRPSLLLNDSTVGTTPVPVVASTTTPVTTSVATSFIPIFDDTTNLVVGFGQAKWGAYSSGPSSSANSILILKQLGTIVPQNATAVFTPPQTLTANQLTQLLSANAKLSSSDSILAPTLVR